MTEAEARALLEATGAPLNIVSVYLYSSTVSEGDVISMSPPFGTLVVPDATVTLTVSLGILPVYVSRWIGIQNDQTGVPLHEEASEEAEAVVVVFVDLNIPGDRVRVHNALPTLKWGGNSWTGVGLLGKIEAITESLEVLAQPVRLTVSGVEPNLIADMNDVIYHGSDVAIYVGLLDVDTYDFIDTPEVVWEGFIDVMWIDVDQGQAIIRVDCEHRLRRQPATSRYTDEDQRAHYSSTDRIFDKLHLIPGYRGRWGSRDTGFGGGGGGGSGGRSHHQEV